MSEGAKLLVLTVLEIVRVAPVNLRTKKEIKRLDYTPDYLKYDPTIYPDKLIIGISNVQLRPY